jgi:hypothetical protein
MKEMTILHQASLQELVKRVRGGAGPKRDDQPASSFLRELNRVKRVRGGAEYEGDDHPAPSFSARVS